MNERATQAILVIDDSPDIHELIDIRLKAESVSIAHALDADEGLETARRDKPDLVLLDLDLAGKNGLEVCRAMKRDPDLALIPIIFLTGTVDVPTKVQAFDAGAVDYVTKPFDAVELRARVRSALRTKRYQDLLSTRAQLDALTGLWNRGYFDQVLTDEVSFFQRHRRHVALIMVDVDHFKRINDGYGHPFGDEVLGRVADVLRRTTRTNEHACRYGGEEFAIVLRETDAAGARTTAERIREQIAEIDLRKGGDRVPITASLGVATSETLAGATGSLVSADLLRAADAALYEAKRSGRNRVQLAEGPGHTLTAGSTAHTVTLRSLRPVAELLRVRGIDVTAAFGKVGVDVARMADPSARVDVKTFCAAWHEAERRVPDPALGVRAAALFDWAFFLSVEDESEYLLLQLVATAPTVRAALVAFADHAAIGFGALQVELAENEVRFRAEAMPRTFVEFAVSMVVFLLRDLPETPVVPTSVAFAHPASAGAPDIARSLGTTPRFDAGTTILQLESSALDVPLRTARPALHAKIAARAEALTRPVSEEATDASSATRRSRPSAP